MLFGIAAVLAYELRIPSLGARTLIEYAAGSDRELERLLLFASPSENDAAFPLHGYGTDFAVALAIAAAASLLVSLGLWRAHERRAERAHAELLANDAFLAELSELFRGASQAGDLLVEVARRVARHLGVSHAFFNETDEAAQVGVVHQPQGSGLPPPVRVLPLADIAADDLSELRAGRTIVNVDARADARTLAQSLHAPEGVRALVAVPLQREGRWAMTLLVSHSEPRAWRARDISLIESVAERTWLWAEHLRHLQAIRQREEDLEVTIQSIGEGIITTDRQGRVAQMNRVAEKLTGWSSAEARGRALAEVYRVDTEATSAPAESAIDRALHQGSALYLVSDTTLLARDGRELPITESAAPITGLDGATRGVVLAFRDESLRRSSEEALRSSEAKYRKLYESLPDMCATVDLRDEVLVDCNETLGARLGYTKSELIGQPMTTLYDPEQLGFMQQARAALQRDGDLRDQERVLRRKDGSLLEVSLSAVNFEGPGGGRYAVSVWRDISARKQAERDLRLLAELGESARLAEGATQLMDQWAARLLEYLDVDRVGFAEVDIDRDLFHVRAELSRGQPPLAGTHSLSAFGAETRLEHRAGQMTVLCDTQSDPRTAALYESAYRPAQIRACISVPVLRDGRWIASLTVMQRSPRSWTEREITLVQQAAERAWLWIEHFRLSGALREREAAAAAQAGERRFRVLVDAVQDYAIFLLDAQGNVSTWNEGARRLKGYEVGEVLGKSFSHFYTDEDRARKHSATVLEHAARDGSYSEEGWRVRKDGSKFWADVLVTALRDANGNLEGFAKVTRDHTERRRTEQILRDREVALVAGLREREILLQEVHHRVKNNLQLISSLINFQCRELEPGTARDALDACRDRVRSIALIHERLYRSQDYANMSFADYARNLTSSIYHATGVAPARVGLALQLEDIAFSVEKAVPCGLILNELMTNALKHAFPGERTGALSVALRRVPGPLVELAVGDDGIGMAQDAAATARGSLGLQLVSMLVEQLEGKLDVIRDHGTTFRVTFPAESRA
jgi:PAS domain S-box-containing protein